MSGGAALVGSAIAVVIGRRGERLKLAALAVPSNAGIMQVIGNPCRDSWSRAFGAE
jgi:hypothetical protein